MTARQKVIEVIAAFPFQEDYGLPNVVEEWGVTGWMPALADKILDALDAQPFHTINVGENSWVIKHPLDCRPDLYGCAYNTAALELDGPPDSGVGVYQVALTDLGRLIIGRKDPATP
jgi:hypothetical protein